LGARETEFQATGGIEVRLSSESDVYRVKIPNDFVEKTLKVENPEVFGLVEPLIFNLIKEGKIPKAINFISKEKGLHHREVVEEKTLFTLYLVKREGEYYLLEGKDLTNEEEDDLTKPN
jgi:hypothetical protein